MNTASIHDYRLGRELFSDSLASTMEARGQRGRYAFICCMPILRRIRSYSSRSFPSIAATPNWITPDCLRSIR
jgi:hypothetical protein